MNKKQELKLLKEKLQLLSNKILLKEWLPTKVLSSPRLLEAQDELESWLNDLKNNDEYEVPGLSSKLKITSINKQNDIIKLIFGSEKFIIEYNVTKNTFSLLRKDKNWSYKLDDIEDFSLKNLLSTLQDISQQAYGYKELELGYVFDENTIKKLKLLIEKLQKISNQKVILKEEEMFTGIAGEDKWENLKYEFKKAGFVLTQEDSHTTRNVGSWSYKAVHLFTNKDTKEKYQVIEKSNNGYPSKYTITKLESDEKTTIVLKTKDANNVGKFIRVGSSNVK